MRKLITALITLTALALSSCGGGDSTSGSDGSGAGQEGTSADVNPCKLLTPEELESSIGRSFGEGELDNVGGLGGTVCGWSINDDELPVGVFSLSVVTDDDISGTQKDAGWTIAKIYSDGKKEAVDPQDVDGLGDQAYISGPTLFVLDGDLLFLFGPDGSPGAADRLRELAALALERV